MFVQLKVAAICYRAVELAKVSVRVVYTAAQRITGNLQVERNIVRYLRSITEVQVCRCTL